ncbi:nucleolar protein 12-domain-containing protein [Lipomyces oligophaga]|uniref:nucleolar protein 12-domain-containing protein n=1 Tax=Lipomyces oligophaga TaxID=45792 RepID=UPI0034CD5FF3
MRLGKESSSGFRGRSRGGSRGGHNSGNFRGRPGGRRDRRPREITFDSEARQEYLTGFHKRKVERREYAQAKAVEQERREKLEERRAIREQRKQELEEKMQFAQNLYNDYSILDSEGDLSSNDDQNEDEWTGIDDHSEKVEQSVTPDINSILKKGKSVTQTFESDDEAGTDSKTTVVIEAYDSTAALEFKPRPPVPEPSTEEVLRNSLVKAGFYAQRVKKINNGIPVPPKQKKKKFKYLTSQERSLNRKKEFQRNRRA